jgi:cathepsin L
LFLSFIVASFALSDLEYRSAFEDFKTSYGKTYDQQEAEYRYGIFKDNLDFVSTFDSQTRGFTVAMNEFGDFTAREFASIYNGLNITRRTEKRNYVESTRTEFADQLDWRTKGAVTPVKNQGQCGSCWSFSATGSMEAAHFFSTGNLVSLSEQDLVDCSTKEGNEGCRGGLMDDAFQYVIENKGIDTEDSYPYTATGPNACKFNSANIGATISSFVDVKEGSESDLLDKLQKQPVSVAIDASHNSFQFYNDGVYFEPACSSTRLDHGVLAVGYGSDDSGADYWIVKNSWGPKWGNKGYINMARNKNNNCGIATAASIPIA